MHPKYGTQSGTRAGGSPRAHAPIPARGRLSPSCARRQLGARANLLQFRDRAAQLPARLDPGERPADAGIIRCHLRRPDQAFQPACVVANRLHVVGRDLQEPSQILVEQPDDAKCRQPRRAHLDRPPETTSGDLGDLPAAERAAAGQTPVCAKSFGAGADRGSDAHAVRHKDVIALNIHLADPVDSFPARCLGECILQCADVNLWSVEVGQMQDRGTCLVQDVLRLTAQAHPGGPAAARMALVHFGPNLREIRPIARHLHATRTAAPERTSDVAGRHRMQVHLIGRQPDAVIDKVAALEGTQGRLGIENIGRVLLELHVGKQPREFVHAACDHAHGDRGLAQLGCEVKTGRAGRAEDGNFRHDGAPMGCNSRDATAYNLPICAIVESQAYQPPAHEPSSEFAYGFSIDVLGAAVEKVTGQRLGEGQRSITRNRTELLQAVNEAEGPRAGVDHRPKTTAHRNYPSLVGRIYNAVIPPSTNSNEPVTYDASFDARKRMHAATSSALPGRLSIVRLAAFSLYWATVWPAA